MLPVVPTLLVCVPVVLVLVLVPSVPPEPLVLALWVPVALLPLVEVPPLPPASEPVSSELESSDLQPL